MYTIIYLSPWSVGGFTSFTSHLARCLPTAQVFRCNTDRDERTERELKGHDFKYRNVSVKTAMNMARSTPTLITAVGRPQDFKDPDTIPKLLWAGAKICVQSTQEFKQFPHVEALRKDGSQVVVIREQLKKYFPGSKYLPHPYVRVFDERDVRLMNDDRRGACSTCMVATNKHPEILLGANDELPRKKQIQLFGKCTTHFLDAALKKKYDTYSTPKGFRTSMEAAQIASRFNYSVDLSDYEGDGGGTQYSFLEAMDAGAIPIIHSAWENNPGDMRNQVNCLAVSCKEDLIREISRDPHIDREGPLYTLDTHGPESIRKVMKRVML